MSRTARSLPPRAARSLAPVVLGALLLSGCGGTAVRTGAAATIGSERITSTDLQRIVDRDLAVKAIADQVGSERAAFQRQVLTNLLRSDLIASAAGRKQVTVTDGEVDAQLADLVQRAGGQQALEAQAAQSLVAPAELRRVLRDGLYRQKLGDVLTAGEAVPAEQLRALYTENIGQFDSVTARHIVVATAAEARQVLAQVTAAPATFAQVAAARSTDASTKATGGLLPPIGRGTTGTKLEAALFAAKPGALGTTQEQDGFHVFQLVKRTTRSLAEATPELRRQVLQQQTEAALLTELRAAERRDEVKVNPRFGRWDRQNVVVADSTGSGPGVVSSPAADGSGVPAAGDPAAGDPAAGAPGAGNPAQQQVTPEESAPAGQ